MLERYRRFIRRKSKALFWRIHDAYLPSYSPEAPAGDLWRHGELKNVISGANPAIPIEFYLEHCFDLLGSGWTKVGYGMECRGLEGHRYDGAVAVNPDRNGEWVAEQINRANFEESSRIWRLLVSINPDYYPIDWQLDFKSGYRWSARIWYDDIRFGHVPGIDIKVPWELSRMQHLPQLALAVLLESTSDKERIKKEIQCQILDFIALNPPRWGVNWACPMEVAIRAANWLLSFDFLCAAGTDFSPAFLDVFKRSIYEHGRHIITNLEWDRRIRGNHYLANIAGLLFVAAYLPRTPQTDAWLAFAVQELAHEVDFQFYQDGACFEAATAYHRLSTELVFYATALTLGLPAIKENALLDYTCSLIKGLPKLQCAPLPFYDLPEVMKDSVRKKTPFPSWYFERVERMVEFALNITRPDGRILQIGDNDSGRLFKLFPVWQRMPVTEAVAKFRNLSNYNELPFHAEYWREETLDVRHLAAAAFGLFNRQSLKKFAGTTLGESQIIAVLAGGVKVASYRDSGAAVVSAPEAFRIGNTALFTKMLAYIRAHPACSMRSLPVSGPGLMRGLKLTCYQNFGLFNYSSERLWLAVRCGPVGQNGNGGHAHNDQLSFELWVDGQPKFTDPGSYLYTPLSDMRNAYRSVRAHWAPRIPGREPAPLDIGLFRLPETAKATCLCFLECGFVGRHEGYGETLYLAVELKDETLTAYSAFEGKEKAEFPAEDESTVPFSPGYGWQCRQVTG